ncbi:MAG: transglutaminase-like cysteine peptidase [Elusimicrobiota bacterium]
MHPRRWGVLCGAAVVLAAACVSPSSASVDPWAGLSTPSFLLRSVRETGFTDFPAYTGREHSGDRSLFGYPEVVARPRKLEKLSQVLARHRRAQAKGRAWPSGWKTALQELRKLDRQEQLREVNSRFNRIPYRADKDDYWAAPYELIRTGSGDCEDYAIAKYLALWYLGWPEEQLRIVYVESPLGPHMILAVYGLGDCWVLDNLSAEVLPSSRVSSYRPVFAMNRTMLYVYSAVPMDVFE